MACQRILSFGRSVKVQKRESPCTFASLTAGSTRSALSSMATGSCRNCKETRIAVFNIPINWPAARPCPEMSATYASSVPSCSTTSTSRRPFPRWESTSRRLRSGQAEEKRRNQRSLYTVRESKFGLHADSRDTFGPDEVNEQPIPEDGAHQDADGVKDNSRFQRLGMLLRYYVLRHRLSIGHDASESGWDRVLGMVGLRSTRQRDGSRYLVAAVINRPSPCTIGPRRRCLQRHSRRRMAMEIAVRVVDVRPGDPDNARESLSACSTVSPRRTTKFSAP